MTAAERKAAEAEADRILSSPEARRKRARIEAAEFTEADGRAMWENVPGMPGVHRNDFQDALDVTAKSSQDLGEQVGIQLGRWAGANRVRWYALDRIRGVPVPSVKHFAAVQGVSESFVHRQIRLAKKVRGSLALSR